MDMARAGGGCWLTGPTSFKLTFAMESTMDDDFVDGMGVVVVIAASGRAKV